MSIKQGAAETERGYRRGVVLGLTLAESMLLLLFCLLLASAAILREKQREVDNLNQRIATTLPDLPKLPSVFPPSIRFALTGLPLDLMRDLAQAVRDGTIAQEDIPLLIEASREIAAANKPAPDEFWRELKLATELAERAAAPDSGISLEPLTTSSLAQVVKLAERLAGRDLSEVEALIAAAGGPGEHDWPPIINLSDAQGYSFESGKADIEDRFESYLKTSIADQLVAYLAEYSVDIIEVIGHTDEQKLWPDEPSNLDDEVLPAIRGNGSAAELIPADNAGLGLARAIAVARILMDDDRLKGITILPLSAGQTTMTGALLSDGTQLGNVSERRRIEIRMIRRPKN